MVNDLNLEELSKLSNDGNIIIIEANFYHQSPYGEVPLRIQEGEEGVIMKIHKEDKVDLNSYPYSDAKDLGLPNLGKYQYGVIFGDFILEYNFLSLYDPGYQAPYFVNRVEQFFHVKRIIPPEDSNQFKLFKSNN